jgi:hypothetical protein
VGYTKQRGSGNTRHKILETYCYTVGVGQITNCKAERDVVICYAIRHREIKDLMKEGGGRERREGEGKGGRDG